MDHGKPIEETLPALFWSLLSGVHTCQVGQVLEFKDAPPRLKIQLVNMRKHEGVDAAPVPPLDDVPIKFFGAGDYWQTCAIPVGSYVLLLISERSLDAWLAAGGVVDPKSPRKFSLSDAIAIPGVLSNVENSLPVPSEGLLLGSVDRSIQISVNSAGVRTSVGTSEVSVTDDGVTSVVGAMAFEVTSAGAKAHPLMGPLLADVQAYSPVGPPPGYVSLATHTHLCADPGSASGPPVPAPGPP